MALVDRFNSFYRYIASFFIVLSLLMMAACGSLDNSDLPNDSDNKELKDGKKVSEIYFEDKALRDCIIEKDIAYVFEFQTLSCNNRGIVNLTGLEYFTGLTHLELYKNNIRDISPLEGLTKITNLYLSDNTELKSIKALSYMENLTELYSNRTSIDDISPILNARNMSYLGLNENKVSDLTPLINLHKLNAINLAGNGLSDISFLNNLQSLEELYLHNNSFTEVPNLSSLINLKYLSLGQNQLTSICNVGDLTSLNALDITYADISADVKCLDTLVNIDPDYKIDFTGSVLINCYGVNYLATELTEKKIKRPEQCP